LNLAANGAGNVTLDVSGNNSNITIGGNIAYSGSGAGSESISMGSGTWTVSGSISLNGGTLDSGTSTLIMNGIAVSWSAFGSTPFSAHVLVLTTYNGNLVAGGTFLNAGGDANADYIAQWNGSAWSAFGATPFGGTVSALTLYNGNLVAGGGFANAGGDANADYIAQWNGSAWSAFGATPLSLPVYALTIYNGNLVAGGQFLNAGGDANADYIAQWNGSAWSAFGTTPFSYYVFALTVYNGNLVAGGAFLNAGGDANADYIAQWNGSAWSALGTTPFNTYVRALTLYNGNLVAGGDFVDAGGDANADYAAQWNGSAWSAFGTTPFNSSVLAFTTYNGNLVAGGQFSNAGVIANANGMAQWNGSAWSAFGTTPLGGYTKALTVYNGNLVTGGDFTNVGGDTNADYIAQWGSAYLNANGQSLNNFQLKNTTSSNQTLNLSGNLTTNGYLYLTADGTGNSTLDASAANPNVTVTGTLDYTGSGGGTESISFGSGTWNLKGTVDLTAGTITAGTSEVILSGTSNQSITSASQSFYKLTSTNASASPGVTFVDNLSVTNMFKDITPSSTLTFTAGTTAALADINLNGGAVGTRVTVRSTTTSAANWSVTAVTQTNVTYVTASYNNASGGQAIGATNASNLDGGNTTHWLWPVLPHNISGTCLTKTGSVCTNGETIKVAVNADLVLTDTGSTLAGSWELDVPVASGDIVTIFIFGVSDDKEANAVTKYDGTGDITGVQLIEESLSIGSADNQTFTNTELGTYDNTVSASEDIFFDVDASSNLTGRHQFQSYGGDLYIKAGNTLTSSNVVTVYNVKADGTLSGTADVDTTGNVTGGGTISLTAGIFTQLGTGDFGGGGDWTFYKLNFGNGSDGTTVSKTLSNRIQVTAQMNIAGTKSLSAGSSTWEMNGDGNFSFGAVRQVVAGAYFHCVVRDGDGAVFCWGANDFGQLGIGTSGVDPVTTPVQVHGPGDSGFLTGVSSVSAGSNHACAVMTNGDLYCWGDNTYGQLGINTSGISAYSYVPIQVHGENNSGSLTGITSVYASIGYSTCATKSDNYVYCWGRNTTGQLGDNSIIDKYVPVKVHGVSNLGNLQNISHLSGGSNFTCAMKSDGSAAYCWGDDGYGQLGDNGSAEIDYPVQVHGISNSGTLGSIVQLETGNNHVCVVRTDNIVYCWGFNLHGQLGDNSTTSRGYPMAVHGLSNSGSLTGMAKLATPLGNGRGCAISTDGNTIACWGYNNHGQLGDGTVATDRLYPVRVLGESGGYLSGIGTMAGGNSSNAALGTDNNTVYTWGSITYGQLGNGAIADSYTPTHPTFPASAAGVIGLTGSITAQTSTFEYTANTSYADCINLPIFTYNNLKINSAGTNKYCATDDLSINDFTILDGTAQVAAAKIIDVKGNINFTGGTFTPDTSEVILSGSSNQSITSASQSFYKLTSTNASASPGVTFVDNLSVTNMFKDITASSTLTFTASTTATLADINLNGGATGTRIVIRSTTTTAAIWSVTAATQTEVAYVSVSYNDASPGQDIDALDGTSYNGGNNTGWLWPVTVSGSLYDAIGGSKITTAKTIKASVNGATATSTSSSSGDFTVTLSSLLVANDKIAIFVDGDAVLASTITKVSAAGNLTGIDLYHNYTTIRHEGSITSITNTDLAIVDNLVDTDHLVTVNGSNVATFTQGLYVLTAKTYAPGGDIVVTGSVNTVGTFTPGAYTITLNGSTNSQTVTQNGNSFYNLTVKNTHASGVILSGATSITNNLSLSADGASNVLLDAATNNPNVTVGGSISYIGVGAGTESISMGSGTWTVSGSINLQNGTITSGSSTLIMNGVAVPWSAFGATPLSPGSSVYALTLYNGNLVAAGLFFNAGGDANADYIAQWNGSAWSAFGTTPFGGSVSALTVYNGNLVASGDFLDAGGDANADYIAQWNGSAWSAFGTTPFDSSVYALTLYNSNLVAGGYFLDAGGNANADYVAQWNGSSWSAFGTTPFSSTVSALTVYSGNLVVGGTFLNAGGDANADKIAQWNGSAWSAFGTTPFGNSVSALTLYNGNLVAGGDFVNAGGDANADYIAQWESVSLNANGQSLNNFQLKNTTSSNQTLNLSGDLTTNGYLYVTTDGTGNSTLDASIANPNVTVTGFLDYTGSGGGTESVSLGSGTWNLKGNVVLTAGTITAGTSEVILSGTGNQSITSASQSFYKLTSTNASTSPGVTFVDNLSVTNMFKDITPSSTLTFTAGTTATLADINLNGGATGTRIVIRSTTTTAANWSVTAATQTEVAYVSVSYNDASPGQDIDATDGTSYNGGNNTGWLWPSGNSVPTNDSLTFSNPYGGSGNTAISDDTTEWQFQAKVSDTDGLTDVNYVMLRLANNSDSTTPYDSVRIKWDRATNAFSEDADTQSAITLGTSSSSSSGSQWTINFKFKVNNSFLTKDTQYAAELYSIDAATASDLDNYANFYQVTNLSISLDIDEPTLTFGSLIPGDVYTGDTRATTTTNYPNGYTLAVSDNVSGSDSALLRQSTSVRVPDYAGTIGTPTYWSSGNGFGMCVYAGASKDSGKWGTGTTYSSSFNKYTGVPETAVSAIVYTKTGSPINGDAVDVGYKLVVSNAQMTGDYSGSVIFTSVGVLQ